jgi:hypothetical protein
VTPIDATTFAVLLWGSLLGVGLVFLYEAYAVVTKRGGGTYTPGHE